MAEPKQLSTCLGRQYRKLTTHSHDMFSRYTEVVDELLSRQEAADYLGVKARTLEIWASTGRHSIPYVRIGREVRYRKSDLEKVVDRLLITPESQ